MRHLWLFVLMLVALPALAEEAAPVTLPKSVAQSEALTYLVRAFERESASGLRGEVREIQVFPPRKPTEQTLNELPAPPVLTLGLLAQNFQASFGAGEPLAGRETLKLRLEPRQKFAPRWTFWFDREWGVRLAFEETDYSGSITSKASFLRLDGAPVAPEVPRKLRRAGVQVALEERLATAFPDFELPAGFRLVAGQLKQKNTQRRLELRASNGISVLVLVFASKTTQASAKLVVKGLAGAWLWVVGNLPKGQLEHVASGINGTIDLEALPQVLGVVPVQMR